MSGLAIRNFDGAGIELIGSGNEILGNFIGTNAAGNAAAGNGTGVLVRSVNNHVGDATPAGRNVISGNDQDGVAIAGALSTGNGVHDHASASSAPARSGRTIASPATPAPRAPITIRRRSWSSAPRLLRATSSEDGFSSTDSGGRSSAPAATRNVVAGNALEGVKLDAGASDNNVTGNAIGVDRTNNAALGNGGPGVLIQNASDNSVGADTISANGDEGVSVIGGAANRIDSNRIGTNFIASAALGNSTARHRDPRLGRKPGYDERDLRQPHARRRARRRRIDGQRAARELHRDNNVGAALGNARGGVQITGGASGNTVGGDGAMLVERNVIAFNGTTVRRRREVVTGEGNAVIGNSIYSNTGSVSTSRTTA